SNLFLKPSGFSSHTKLCKNIRTVLKPICLAHPNSRSIVSRSKVSSCHISIWLTAVDGTKLHPTIQGCSSYHSLAFSLDHLAGVSRVSTSSGSCSRQAIGPSTKNMINTIKRNFPLLAFILLVRFIVLFLVCQLFSW